MLWQQLHNYGAHRLIALMLDALHVLWIQAPCMQHLNPCRAGSVHLYLELKRCDAAVSGTATACPAASTKLMCAYTNRL